MTKQDGFTLPELLISMVILGIIVGAVSMAMIAGLNTEKEQQQRLLESHDAELVATFLPSDLQSASSVVAAPVANTECSGVTNLLRLRWTEQFTTTGSTNTFVAAYAISGSSLIRYFCTNGGSAEQLVVARNLANPCGGGCAATVSGRRVSLQLTAASGYTYAVTGTGRTP